MGAKEVQPFLSDLAVNHHGTASTQNQALSAILFLYQEVRRPRRHRAVTTEK